MQVTGITIISKKWGIWVNSWVYPFGYTQGQCPGLVIQPGNREWVTSIECVNSMGWALPPCIVFKGSVHIEGWYQDSKLPHNWRIEVSPNGWTSDQIGLRWLQKVFIPETTSRTTGKYRLLILDGHGSHLVPKFDKVAVRTISSYLYATSFIKLLPAS